jgi:hypothetical protein
MPAVAGGRAELERPDAGQGDMMPALSFAPELLLRAQGSGRWA